ncbi:MAG: DUF790 family protein [Pirellulaceae bacterium]|nr:DUF790 family protein [Pirellulaceae bacterium]
MLTRELAIAAFENGQAIPDRLYRMQHARYLLLAERMLDVYRMGCHRMRRSLHRDIHAIFDHELDCPPQRIDAFCKLLDDASEFKGVPSSQAAKLRIQVFQRAASMHPLVSQADRWFEHQEQAVKDRIATELGEDWTSIEQRLFGDLIEFHRLEKCNDFASPSALLARYNVAQTQAALFDAQKMTVVATEDFKQILRYAKLARIMHTIHRERDGVYRFEFDGPTSLLQSTHRYGAAMARFLPGLIACRGWRLWALLKPPRWQGYVTLSLTSNSGLTSSVATSDEFDSSIESAFAAKWGSEPRDGWTLERETEILHLGQKVFIPDFVFRNDDGRKVMMEVIGFWTPEYLQSKLETLKQFQGEAILLAVAESNKQHFEALDQPMFFYKKAIKIGDALATLQALENNR